MRGIDDDPDGRNDRVSRRALGGGRKRRGTLVATETDGASHHGAACPCAYCQPTSLPAGGRREDPLLQPSAELTPAQRYLDAFDAVAAIGADLVLDDRDHPGASDALTAWASVRGKPVVRRNVAPCDCWAGVVSVDIGIPGASNHRSIDVYLRSA